MAKNRITLHFVNLNVENDVLPAHWYKEKHSIKGLCIRNGNITAIESNAFNTKAFKHLYYLEFDGMAIKYFKSGIFNGLVSLRVLILRNLKWNIFQSNLLMPTQNSARNDVNRIVDVNHDLIRSSLMKNCSTSLDSGFECHFNILPTCIDILYLNEDNKPTTPWIILKKLKVIVTTLMTSSLFSFSIGMKLSFSILHTCRKISWNFKKFINNLENDAAAMYILNDVVPNRIRSPIWRIRKIRKLHLFDWHSFLFK